MLLARAVTGRREIVRNAWNIYRNPKLIKTSHHSSRGSFIPAYKTRDWISFKIFTYDAPADQWSCTQRDNELAADLMLRVQTQESQALWSPITNGEIIFMIPAARGICIQIYIHIFTSFVYMNAFLLWGNTRLSPGLPGSHCHCLNLHFSNNMWLRNENNDWFHVSVQRSKYHHFQSVISNIKFRLCSIVILIQTV